MSDIDDVIKALRNLFVPTNELVVTLLHIKLFGNSEQKDVKISDSTRRLIIEKFLDALEPVKEPESFFDKIRNKFVKKKQKIEMKESHRLLYSALLTIEGFDVHFVDDSTELRKIHDSTERKIVVDNKGTHVIVAPMKAHGRKSNMSKLERKRYITDTLWSSDVYLLNSPDVKPEHFVEFIRQLELLRWKKRHKANQ